MITPPADESLLQKADQLLHGAVDLHMHTGPDIYPRSVTTIEAAEQARDAGMHAIVVKSHSTDTAARAELVRDVTGFAVYGGISLNYAVGGINPHAIVETADQGGRIVWMPTTSARHFLLNADNAPILREKTPLAFDGLVATEGDAVLPETEEVLRLIAANDLILCTGHLTPEESLIVFRRAREVGVKRLVVTHPHADFIGMSTDQMSELADLGALNEMHIAFTSEAIQPPQRLEEIAAAIREVGVERCIMATDGGQKVNQPPLEMMRIYIARMLELGFTEEEIETMTGRNPRLMLDGTADELDAHLAASGKASHA